MKVSRRSVLRFTAAAPAIVLASRLGTANAATTIKISHQFPGGTITDGDFRDRMCRIFGEEIGKRSKGSLAAEIYPNSSLVKTVAQFSAVRKGALDMTLYPLNYAGGEVPEVNIGFMPAVVSSYEQGYKWKTAAIGKKMTDLLADKGVVLVSWLWQAGGAASRGGPCLVPDDVKGKKVRGGSAEMDEMLKAAGAAVVSMPSNELYAAMQTGAMDVAMTTATSLISFRLEELSKNLTVGRSKSFFFVFEPLLMSKSIFDGLSKDDQKVIMDVGLEMEKFGRENAQADDNKVAQIYEKAGAKAADLTQEQTDKWKALARESCWKNYEAKSAGCAEFLKLSQQV